MRYLRINNLDVNDELDKYYTYFDGQQKEIEINKGFKITKEILEFLQNNRTDEVVIRIEYIDEILSYLIEANGKSLESHKFNNVNFEMIENKDYNNKLKYNKKLYGCVSPLELNEKKVNFLDDLIGSLEKDDFIIEVKLRVAKREDVKAYKKELEGLLIQLSKESETNINVNYNIIKQKFYDIIGEDRISNRIENIDKKYMYDVIKEEYNTIAIKGILFEIPFIDVSSNNETLVKVVADKMKIFSNFSINKTRFLISDDLNEIEFKYCSTDFVASVLALPITNLPGISIRKEVEYGADLSVKRDKSISLGKLFKNHQTNINIDFNIDDLTMHTFVSGVTGSGKTSTIKKILYEVTELKKPFLVLEPAKSEYRNLESFIDIQRFCLGIEGKYSFRLNPFEFPENIHIQTHLDNLKSVFVAAFPMYGPMPYILETAIYSIYKRVGWDLISSNNIYKNKLEHKYLYPTLKDLFDAIDEVTEDIGYSDDLNNDVKGALKVRVGSLMSGAKGGMLNTNNSNSIKELLEKPSIIELENIGDSQEKVFLMGLIFISIYEHYVSNNEYTNELKNLLVIEEAHRLLENTSASNNNELADVKGKAIENFNNILSEIRAYGEGIIVADQIPSKLSPDIIKNTNLKIIHRLFAEDDRKLVGNSIGLSDEQIKGLIHLEKGQAVIFHSDVYEPIKARINIDEEKLLYKNITKERLDKLSINNCSIAILNDRFVNDAFKIINSFILFDVNCEQIELEIGKLLNKYYCDNAIEFASNDIDNILKELLVVKVRKIRNDANIVISYFQEINIINNIHKSSSPFKEFINFIDTINNDVNNPYRELSECYNRFQYLFKNKIDYNFTNKLTSKYVENFKQENEILINEIINKSQIDRYVNLNNLNTYQISQLANAVIIISFSNDPVIIDYYFSIEDILPNYKEILQVKKKGEKTIDKDLSNDIKELYVLLEKTFFNMSALTEKIKNNQNKTNRLIIFLSVIFNLILLMYLIVNK